MNSLITKFDEIIIVNLKFKGYSFWDPLRNFYTNLHELFCHFISWADWVNSGKFMNNCWTSCQVMADMKKVYDDLIIINLYTASNIFHFVSFKIFFEKD